MWKKAKRLVIAILAVIGVLLLAMVFLETDEEETGKESTGTIENSEDSGKGEQEEKEENQTTSVTIPESEIQDKKLEFSGYSLEDKSVDQSIFADYELTIVHVWGTFCSPCIAEMGEYAKLYKELPENVNLIGVVCDVNEGSDSNVSAAKDILKDAGAEFLNLRINDELETVTGELQFVPSSFFVDSKGRLVGKLMDGAGIEETKKRLEGYLK